jgi:phosphatidylglycerophosphatase C
VPLAPNGTPVAAFDFDGTLSRRDTFLPFLQRVCGAQRLYRALFRSGPALSRMAAGRADRDAVKDALLVRLLAGHPADALEDAGAAYADFLRRSDRLRPDTLARAEDHLRRGHRVVVVSASPSVYLEPLAASLGFAAALATRLEVDDGGRITGRMLGGNCRGPEKVARLDAWLGGEDPPLYAYGDSAGDRELLARAHVGVKVRPRVLVPPLGDDHAARARDGGPGPR